MSTSKNCRTSTMGTRFLCLENTKILRKLERKLFKVRICICNSLNLSAVYIIRPEKIEYETITGHFGFVPKENLDREIAQVSRLHPLILFTLFCFICFRKAPFSKCFPSTLKRKVNVFKFLRFEERFREAPFSWRIIVDGRPDLRMKAAFSNFSRSVLEGTLS